jgi:hypothetical protein
VPGIRRDRWRAEQRFGAGCGETSREKRPEREAERRRDETERGGLEQQQRLPAISRSAKQTENIARSR